MLVKVAFSFYFLFGVFEETHSWTIDLPQVRKYFFEKSLKDKAPDKLDTVVYDNIDTHSPHFDYEKYREHYADEYEYNGYMEQKVHDAVRNGSAYLEGLRRSIENFTLKLEGCRRMNFTVNILELQPNILNLTNPNLSFSNITNLDPNSIDLPANFTQNFPANFTRSLNTNFTEFMRLSGNATVFNANRPLRECMRADRASEHVRRLAQLAIWAATELQDKLYADKYDKRGEDHDGTLILKLAWFLDRLAHLTGYDPQPHQFVEPEKVLEPEPYIFAALPRTPTPTPQSLVPGLVSNEDLRFLMTCLMTNSSEPASERCAFPPRRVSAENPVSFMNRNYPGPPSYPTDLIPSGSENHEYTYTYTDQDYAEENMPLPLPPKRVTAVRTKRKRSVRGDPLQELFQYLVKNKAWTGSNQVLHASGEIKDNSLPNKRVKRFIVRKKLTHLKQENPFALSNLAKHKIGVHCKKDKEQEKKLKDFFEKLNVKRPSKGKLKLFKKAKRSVGYMKKYQPRVPVNPQGDISYYVKNKKGTEYNYNTAQALLVRAGLEQVFQTGNIEVVRRYGSNYNPAVVDQTLVGALRGLGDV